MATTLWFRLRIDCSYGKYNLVKVSEGSWLGLGKTTIHSQSTAEDEVINCFFIRNLAINQSIGHIFTCWWHFMKSWNPRNTNHHEGIMNMWYWECSCMSVKDKLHVKYQTKSLAGVIRYWMDNLKVILGITLLEVVHFISFIWTTHINQHVCKCATL